MAIELQTIRERIKARTDNQYTDGFITDAEVDGLINLHYKELYELLQFAGPHRVETPETITADGSSDYALPVDVYSILTVHRIEDDGTRILLARHDHRLKPNALRPAAADTYRIAGGMRIEFDPVPASGDYLVTYIPIPPDLVDDDDTLDGVLGWEEFVVLAASVDVMVKEAVDPAMIGHVTGQLERIRARIRTAAKAAEMSEAPRIVDVRGGNCYSPDTGHRGAYPVRWPWWGW